jgi:spectinomycin phosphotransferase
MTDYLGIPEGQLRACLRDHYNIVLRKLDSLPGGLDYAASVYRVESDSGLFYLLKTISRRHYEPSCLVPLYLNKHGITSVVAPVPNSSGILWTQLADRTVIVYPFIEGESSFTGMTDEQWNKVGSIFKLIHQVTPPAGLSSLRKEEFDPTQYVRWIRTIEEQFEQSNVGSNMARILRTSWEEHRSTIHTLLNSLVKLAAVLQPRTLTHVICHADLHPANLIRNQSGDVYVIDWDEVMMAPKERDFIFVREPHADAFFQGYGTSNIDIQALTYYRLERVVQDLIECSRNVCLKDSLGEESKADEVKLFQNILADTTSLMELIHLANSQSL